MRTRPAFLALLLVGHILAAAHATAQYMYLDSNGNGVHDTGDALGPNGTSTTVDVYLNTNHNRDGSTATCNTGDGNLTINSYVVNLAASNGTVTYSNFINRPPTMNISLGELNSGNGLYKNGFGGVVALSPGLYRLATITITGTSGTPTIDIVDQVPGSIDWTSFGTQCSGNDFDNTYKLTGPAGGTDWTDVDGLGGGCNASCPPFLAAVMDMTVNEGATATQGLTATDPDGNPLAFQKVSGPLYMTVSTVSPGPGTATGLITLSPGFSDAATGVTASVRALDGILSSNVRSFSITVINVNRQPVSNPGGPYSGVPGVPIAFDGTGSADPDGSPLNYFWDFGDGTQATGPTPAHTYGFAGTYPVRLVVSDGSLSNSASTTATITDLFQARSFTTKSNRIIRLGSGKSVWSVQIEPVAGTFDIANVDLSSVRMESQGTGSVSEISAQFGKAAISSDSDGNGVAEITASFAKGDLQALFANVTGQASVPVTFEGSVTTGGTFRTQMDVNVKASGGSALASAYPNPFHPFGWVSVFVPTPGNLKVKVFDANGRLVRRMEEFGTVPSGTRRIAIDGADDHGAPLPSGIYFLKIETAAGPITTRVAIVR